MYTNRVFGTAKMCPVYQVVRISGCPDKGIVAKARFTTDMTEKVSNSPANTQLHKVSNSSAHLTVQLGLKNRYTYMYILNTLLCTVCTPVCTPVQK